MKKCPQCNLVKEESCFYMTKQGIYSWCKECTKRISREYYYKNREKYIATTRRWQEKNPDKVVTVRKNRYKSSKNQKLHQKRVEEWKKKNPIKAREIQRKGNYTRRSKVAKVYIEDVDHNKVFERDEGICGICQNPVDKNRYHLDHIIPIAKGGLHCYDNVQISHPRCNQTKGANVLAPNDEILLGHRS
jgi:5-methylcytosine-specific restriction endonuclease McrA